MFDLPPLIAALKEADIESGGALLTEGDRQVLERQVDSHSK
jgi:hypothetical protein